MSDSHVGKVVDGRYRLNRVLGSGAAGAVYAATQIAVDRTVAVKLLHASNSERFAAEAKAIAKLNHTNVITLHDFGFDEELGAHFMVTEFAEGIPLSERMREVMSTELILQVALEIASALHHAHAKGITHRDLKPENVILARADGRVDVAKVLDFGLAHLIEDAEDESPASASEPAATSLDELEGFSSSPEKDGADAEDGRSLDALESSSAAAQADAKLSDEENIPGPLGDRGGDGDDDDEVAETAVLKDLDLSADIKFGEEE